MKLDEVFNKWAELNNELAKASREAIIEVLEKTPRNAIDLDDIDYTCCVSYDGGNHPEYASNCFSDVIRAYMRDGKVYLDIEDASDYELENVTAEEMYNVACAVIATYENNYEDGE